MWFFKEQSYTHYLLHYFSIFSPLWISQQFLTQQPAFRNIKLSFRRKKGLRFFAKCTAMTQLEHKTKTFIIARKIVVIVLPQWKLKIGVQFFSDKILVEQNHGYSTSPWIRNTYMLKLKESLPKEFDQGLRCKIQPI